MVIKVIYHGKCTDGFGGAWAAYKKFGLGPHVDYIGWSPNASSIPDIVEKGDEVYIIDLSFDRQTLLDWYDKAAKIVLLDHHISSQKLVGDLHFAHFDMNHSGAWLAWEYFHPDWSHPRLIRHIEDMDLWRWELSFSRELCAVIESYPFDFIKWDELYDRMQVVPTDIIKEGEAILRYKERLIERVCANQHFIQVGGHDVIAVNTPLLQSEVGNRLLKEHPDSPFAATFYEYGDKTFFSLRSEEGREDVSEVATNLGGGGHRNSAGYVMKDG